MAERPLIRVAAGVLQRPDGTVLLAQRPQGKIAAGWWEFPGGKIEAGESGFDALRRELIEELGVEIQHATPLIRFQHDYTDRRVQLETWLIHAWHGEPQPRENQTLNWLPVTALRAQPQALPTVMPIVAALALPTQYVLTAPDSTAAQVLNHLRHLPTGALLRLRWPQWSDADYVTQAACLIAPAQQQGLRVILDRDPAQVAALGADGWHASSAALQQLHARPDVPLALASAHRADDIARAAQLGFDAAVLGSVCPTPSHPDARPLGWAGFTQVRGFAPLPVYAIGGVSPVHLPDAWQAWAQGVAGISAYWPV
ncbi:Nudix family hydrolase [Sinimarinibacterium sp. NLF-5-8]|uniref:Nudix family hydrolase n=1 Tax=Sinimarinibacterium sp. NLF-5-8 TaxID=2698684 RepID=UPI00137BDC50|nr:Nudix family hydrolase [Sinimarinibacterium sp. NLF-5-8]QHS10251.1 Nudix family hydrolase [Sinimarinibacterium sp. NLF-5-8]